nr:hypothetical protein [Tanacetum cinerariifolium]
LDNDIYSTFDACPNACEMWKAIERSQKATTRNRGKAIVNSSQPMYDQEPCMVAKDDETSKDKEIDKLMALISLSIQCYNCKEFGHVARECQKLKRAKDAAYHREKMLLYQELEAHYMYMAQLQEVSLNAADSGPIFDDEPLQKVSNDDHYNVFMIESAYPEQSESVHDTYPIEQDAQILDGTRSSIDTSEGSAGARCSSSSSLSSSSFSTSSSWSSSLDDSSSSLSPLSAG